MTDVGHRDQGISHYTVLQIENLLNTPHAKSQANTTLKLFVAPLTPSNHIVDISNKR